jgi:cytochrome o ubiquinol oxidase subunit 2
VTAPDAEIRLKDPFSIIRIVCTITLVLLAAPVFAGGVLTPQGPIGAAEKTILVDSLAIMLSIVVPTIVATFALAWWFRASNKRARHRPDWEFSGEIELVVWSIPVMVIILLGGVAWIGSYELDPAKRIASDVPALDVEVVSLDWKWLFIYPKQGVASVNELVVPAATPIHFSLTSASVMNAFFVPELGSMIYTMNGMVTQLNLQADRAGTFAGRSAHYSGDGFSDMHFDVRAIDADAFEAWVGATRRSDATLDDAAYGELAKQGVIDASRRFGRVDATLFHRIVMLDIAPAAGPVPAANSSTTKEKR